MSRPAIPQLDPEPAKKYDYYHPLAWFSLVSLIVAAASFGVAYGRLAQRVDVLESYGPVAVDRRLAILETKLDLATGLLQRQDEREQRREAQDDADDRWRPPPQPWTGWTGQGGPP